MQLFLHFRAVDISVNILDGPAGISSQNAKSTAHILRGRGLLLLLMLELSLLLDLSLLFSLSFFTYSEKMSSLFQSPSSAPLHKREQLSQLAQDYKFSFLSKARVTVLSNVPSMVAAPKSN